MKILINSSDVLEIEDKPIFPAIFLPIFIMMSAFGGMVAWRDAALVGALGCAFMAVLGYSIMRSVVRNRTITFDRTDGNVTVLTRSFKGVTRVTHTLSLLDRAIVKEDPNDQDVRDLALLLSGGTDAGLHVVTDTHSDSSGVQAIADAINAWLAATPPGDPA